MTAAAPAPFSPKPGPSRSSDSWPVPVIGPENRLLRFSLSLLPGCGACLEPDSLPGRVSPRTAESDRGPPCYNPLVLVGEAGAGKTEIAHFVASRWCQSAGFPEGDPGGSRRVVHWTGKGLSGDLRACLESESLHRLHARFRGADLLVVDGLDQCHEPEVQGLFAVLLDLTIGSGGQAMITLSHLPGENTSLARSLVTRLCAGLIVKVHPPEQESRRAIVRSLARRRGLDIDEAAILRLAARETDSGSLDKALGTIASGGVDRVESRHVTDLLDSGFSERNPSPRKIITATARQHGLKFEDLVGPSRHRRIAHARSMAIYLVRRLTGKSLVEIGGYFGGRDHTTVLHSVRVVKKRHETDPGCRRAVESVLLRLTDRG